MNPYQTILHFIENNFQDTSPSPEVLKSIKELNLSEITEAMLKCIEYTHLPTLQALFSYTPNIKNKHLQSFKKNFILKAIQQYQWDLVPLLIQNGFDMNCYDKEKNNPLHIVIAMQRVITNVITFLNERKTVIKMLIEGGADINAQNKFGETPLARAIVFRPELVEILLNYNPDVNIADLRGNTPLMRSEDQNIARLLLSKGANINHQNIDGDTALMKAIDSRATGVQLLLIYSQANIFLENCKKETALSKATKNRNKDLIKLLTKLGAVLIPDSREDRFQNLPKFTFFSHRALTQEGVLEETEDPCTCCKKSRNYLYRISYFDKNNDDIEIYVCPWCISEGKFAKKYKIGAHEIEMDPNESIDDKVALEEVETRTPGFCGWQDARWLVHCHTPCIFLGRVGWEDIKENILEIEFKDSYPLHNDLTYMKSLSSDGPPTGYLFKCVKCNKLLMYSDFV